MVRVFLAAACASLLLLGCANLGVDPQADASARWMYDQVRAGGPQLRERLEAQPNGAKLLAELRAMDALIPEGEPRSVKVANWSAFYADGGSATMEIQHVYRYADRRVLATTPLRRENGQARWHATGFHVRVATTEQLAVNALSLEGKAPGQLVFLAFFVLSPLTIVASLIVLVRRGGRKRRFWWALPALLGFSAFKMNWATGALSFQPIVVQFLGAGATTSISGFEPWWLSFSIPVVAILILLGLVARPVAKGPRTAPVGS